MFTRPLSIAALSQTAPYDTFLFRSAARPIYQYLNFDQIEEYVENAKEATA